MCNSGGASRFAVQAQKKQVKFYEFNLLSGCGGRI